MVAQMVLEMVFVFGDEGAFRAFEQLFGLDVHVTLMLPVVLLVHAYEHALFAFEHFGLAYATTAASTAPAAAAATSDRDLAWVFGVVSAVAAQVRVIFVGALRGRTWHVVLVVHGYITV